MADLGSTAMDSNEIRRKKLSHTTLPGYSDLYPDVRDTPPGTRQSSQNPSFTQSSFYPQRSNSRSNLTLDISTQVSSSENPNLSTSPIGHHTPVNDNQNPNLNTPFRNPTHGKSTHFGSHSPTSAKSSPSRKLLQVFQLEEERLAAKGKISSIVSYLENEMRNSGVKVDCTELKTQLNRLVENCGEDGSDSARSEGEHALKIGFNTQAKPMPREDTKLGSQQPVHQDQEPVIEREGKFVLVGDDPNINQGTNKAKNWSSLFKAQAPSRAMKLEHYPEMQKGKDAVIELDESDIDASSWNNCLIGYFLDGKMPYNLLCATTRAVWKENAPVSIKQIGSCFYFVFKDEETKLKVLEEGPYFFSRRYLVLLDWRRMLVPTTAHPPSIPAWVKLHKLPLECWTEGGFSRIASSIGRPIHVDNATASKKRLDFARICVEISARDELPNEVVVKVNGESVVVRVEYQWLPSKCADCKVFGHQCGQKQAPTPPVGDVNNLGDKQTEAKISDKDPIVQSIVLEALAKGGSAALDVVTKVVPHPTKTPDPALNSGGGNTPDSSRVPLGLEDAQASKDRCFIPSLNIDSDVCMAKDNGKGIDTIGTQPPDPPDDNQGWISSNKKNKKKNKQGHNQQGSGASPVHKRVVAFYDSGRST